MSENNIANTLRNIGIATIILGVIGSFICGAVFETVTYDYSYYSGYDIEEAYNWGVVVGGSVSSFIAWILFISFSEVISLLQENVNKQKEILEKISISIREVSAEKSKTELQDIESNLPKMWGVLKWRKGLSIFLSCL